jgi:hypothetical protein
MCLHEVTTMSYELYQVLQNPQGLTRMTWVSTSTRQNGCNIGFGQNEKPFPFSINPNCCWIATYCLAIHVRPFLRLPFLSQFFSFLILYLEIDPLLLLPLRICSLVRSKRFPLLMQNVVDEWEIEILPLIHLPFGKSKWEIQNSMLVHQV